MNAAEISRAPIPEQITDEEIVSRVVAGDDAVFEILMRRHNQRIYRTVRAILRDENEIEDVMQQAYLRAYQHLGQFAGEARFSTWMTRIAVNEALARRKKDRGFFVPGDEEETIRLVDSTTPDPEQQASAAELRTVLEREIAALPEAFRLVIMLRDVEGLSTSEAAATLEVSEDLVKQRLHRARTALRENLYRRAGVTLESLFTFGNTRCDRVVANVMMEIRGDSRR